MSGERPSFLLKVSEPSVVVPARVAALLEARTNIAALRTHARGVDPLVSAVLEDIRHAAMSWADGAVVTRETAGDVGRQLARGSEWLSCTEAAQRLGISRQAVGKAIRTGRLEATEHQGAYRISLTDFEHYRAARTERRRT